MTTQLIACSDDAVVAAAAAVASVAVHVDDVVVEGGCEDCYIPSSPP